MAARSAKTGRELAHSLLIEILDYDPATGVFTWKAPRKKIIVGSVAGHVRENGYRGLKVNQIAYLEHRLAWFYFHGEWPAEEIDHINGIRSDNRIANLREASHSENHQNKVASKANTSGEKGVDWCKKDNAWRARVKLNGKYFSAGYHSSFDEAVRAVRSARERLHGEFCNHGAPA